LLAHFDVDLTIGPVSPAARGPAIVVALHEGVADVLCLLQLGLPLRFAVREEIFEWPGVGAALSRMGHVPINPENGARAYRAMLRAARASLAAGESFAIFPQGTVLGIETAFKCGAFRLAQELRAPIVPVVLTGAHRVWEHPFSARLRYGQRVAAVALDAVPASVVSSMSAESLRGRVEQRMKAVALSGQVPAPRRYVPERDGYWDGYAFEIDPRFAEVAARIAKERQRD
jgi:1-acyl-sn-glycerol-3-phosphate acyltransferase